MSWVYEPVWVGITGGGGCGLSICNPSLTHTHDTGSWVLLVSVVESHAVSKPMKDCTNHPQTAHNNTEQGWPPTNNHNWPPVRGLYCPPVIPAKLGWFWEVEVGRWALPELSKTETSPEGWISPLLRLYQDWGVLIVNCKKIMWDCTCNPTYEFKHHINVTSCDITSCDRHH